MPIDLMVNDDMMNNDMMNRRSDFENVDITLDDGGFIISKYGKIIAEYAVKVTFWGNGKYDMRLMKIK